MLFDVLLDDTLHVIFTCIDPNAVLAASLACTQFNALRVKGRFRTDIVAMNTTPTMYAWAMRLGCPPLRCVRDLNDSDAVVRLRAMRALGLLEPATIAIHAGEVVLKLTDPYVCVSYMAMKALAKLEDAVIDDSVLAQHVDAIAKMISHVDAGVRVSAIYLTGKLDPRALAYDADCVAHKLDDLCVDVRYTSVETLTKLQTAKLRLLICPDTGIARANEHTCQEMHRLRIRIRDKLEHGDAPPCEAYVGLYNPTDDGVCMLVYLLESILDGHHPMVSYVERIERLELNFVSFESDMHNVRAASLKERLWMIDRSLFCIV